MTTKILTTVLATLTFFAVTAANSEEMPGCNAALTRCVVEKEWDIGTGNSTCLDRPSTSTSCTAACLWYLPPYLGGGCGQWATRYHAECNFTYGGMACGSRTLDDEALEISEAFEATCGSSGTYCGWRDGTNMSDGGVNQSARAKLHSCAANGKADEADYDTLSECTSNPIGQTKHADNLYCTDSVWDTLCDAWL